MTTPIDNLFLPSTTETYRTKLNTDSYLNSAGARNFRGEFQRKIILGDLPTKALADISSSITQVSLSYSISMASELAFDVVDVDLKMAANNYFILGRTVIYETQTLGRVDSYTGEIRTIRQLFEIADVSVSQGPGGSATYSIKCYTKAIQQMKRDKKPGATKGNGTQFIRNAAKKYGLDFYGEETTKAKKINKASGSKQSESLWDVMQNLAGDAKFVLFEVDGILIFASEKFLLHKWGTEIRFIKQKFTDPKTKKKRFRTVSRRYIPLQYPNDGPGYRGRSGYFKLTERPTFRKSANDPYAADGGCTVERFNGTQIRPGMTAYVGNVPDMSGYYLIESVSFNEMVPDPVSVSFRTLTRDVEKDEIKMLPLGETYQQTSIDGQPIRTTASAAKAENGKKITTSIPDTRIIGINQATSASPYVYPTMEYANISKTYSAFFTLTPSSTNDRNSVLITGNIDLWNRPILVTSTSNSSYAQTLAFVVYVVAAGSEYRGIVLPRIYTQGGVPVIKTEAEAIQKYVDAGGYSAGAKFLAVVAGATKQQAATNARDYGMLLEIQQDLILYKRFPDGLFVNTPGNTDSEW